jgi:hypothetical protein
MHKFCFNLYMCVSTQREADHIARSIQGMNCLRPLEHWDRWFEFHSRHGCLRFSAFVLFCVQVVALRRADPPSKES